MSLHVGGEEAVGSRPRFRCDIGHNRKCVSHPPPTRLLGLERVVQTGLLRTACSQSLAPLGYRGRPTSVAPAAARRMPGPESSAFTDMASRSESHGQHGPEETGVSDPAKQPISASSDDASLQLRTATTTPVGNTPREPSLNSATASAPGLAVPFTTAHNADSLHPEIRIFNLICDDIATMHRGVGLLGLDTPTSDPRAAAPAPPRRSRRQGLRSKPNSFVSRALAGRSSGSWSDEVHSARHRQRQVQNPELSPATSFAKRDVLQVSLDGAAAQGSPSAGYPWSLGLLGNNTQAEGVVGRWGRTMQTVASAGEADGSGRQWDGSGTPTPASGQWSQGGPAGSPVPGGQGIAGGSGLSGGLPASGTVTAAAAAGSGRGGGDGAATRWPGASGGSGSTLGPGATGSADASGSAPPGDSSAGAARGPEAPHRDWEGSAASAQPGNQEGEAASGAPPDLPERVTELQGSYSPSVDISSDSGTGTAAGPANHVLGAFEVHWPREISLSSYDNAWTGNIGPGWPEPFRPSSGTESRADDFGTRAQADESAAYDGDFLDPATYNASEAPGAAAGGHEEDWGGVWGPAMDLGGGWGGGYIDQPLESNSGSSGDGKGLSWSEWTRASADAGESGAAAHDGFLDAAEREAVALALAEAAERRRGITAAPASEDRWLTWDSATDDEGGYLKAPSRADMRGRTARSAGSNGAGRGAEKKGTLGGGSGGGGGGGGGGDGGGKRSALRKEDGLRRAVAVASLSFPRIGATVTVPLPPVRAPSQNHASNSTAAVAAVGSKVMASAEAAETQQTLGSEVVAEAPRATSWATTRLSYDFSQIYKLLAEGYLPEEVPLPEELVEIAARRSLADAGGGASSSTSGAAEGEELSSDASGGSGSGADEAGVSSSVDFDDDEDGDYANAIRAAAAMAAAAAAAKPKQPGKGRQKRGKAVRAPSEDETSDEGEDDPGAVLCGCTAYVLPGGVEVVLAQRTLAVGPVIAWLRGSLGEDMTLGIDTEWPSTFVTSSGKLALIQIASSTRVALLHVARMRRSVTVPGGPLHSLLSDPSINWVGAGWDGNDRQMIAAAFPGGAPPMRVVDVQVAARAAGWPRVGLQGLAGELLGVAEFTKPSGVTRGNWAAPVMTARQVRYAALDALLPPLILRQLRLFAAMPGLRCAFCKQALHAPSMPQHFTRAMRKAMKAAAQVAQVPAASRANAASKAGGRGDDSPAEVTDTSADPDPTIECEHCGRAFWGPIPAAKPSAAACTAVPGSTSDWADGPAAAKQRLHSLLLATHHPTRGRPRPRRLLFGRSGEEAAVPASVAASAARPAGAATAQKATATKATKKKAKKSKLQPPALSGSTSARQQALMQVYELDPALQAFVSESIRAYRAVREEDSGASSAAATAVGSDGDRSGAGGAVSAGDPAQVTPEAMPDGVVVSGDRAYSERQQALIQAYESEVEQQAVLGGPAAGADCLGQPGNSQGGPYESELELQAILGGPAAGGGCLDQPGTSRGGPKRRRNRHRREGRG